MSLCQDTTTDIYLPSEHYPNSFSGPLMPFIKWLRIPIVSHLISGHTDFIPQGYLTISNSVNCSFSCLWAFIPAPNFVFNVFLKHLFIS